MFNDHCQRILAVIGARVVSLRITLSHTIGGWSLVASAMQRHPTTMLQRLHLIDINHHEFKKLLRSSLLRYLHTLLIDITSNGMFPRQKVESPDLFEVCSRFPVLKICRLPFRFDFWNQKTTAECWTSPLVAIQNSTSSTLHLHTLTLGMNTSNFLEYLLKCIPCIRNLRIGVGDSDINESGPIILPIAADSRLVPYLSRLHLHCRGHRTFHRIFALLSSVLNQLVHLSLKLHTRALSTDPFIVSGDSIQQLCFDRLQSSATYALDLSIMAHDDVQDKIIFNSFLKASFVNRCQPRVIIQAHGPPHQWAWDQTNGIYYIHKFIVFTLPYSGTSLKPLHVGKNPQISSQISATGVNSFPYVKELFIPSYANNLNLIDRETSMSLRVPWSLLTTISMCTDHSLSANQLEAILQLTTNVHTLKFLDYASILLLSILRRNPHLCVFLNRQIRALYIDDITIRNIKRFFKLLVERLPNLRLLSFRVYVGARISRLQRSDYSDNSRKDSQNLVNHLHFLANHLRQLVSIRIEFLTVTASDMYCFLHDIRRQLHEQPLKRPHRRRFISNTIEIWL